MSEAAGAGAPRGFFATLAGVCFAPAETFAAIARRPRFGAAFLALVAAGSIFNGIWLHQLDAREFARVQIDDSPFAERMSPEQRAEGIERQAGIFPFVAWLGPLVVSPLAVLLVAALYLFVFRFFYAGEVTFTQSLSIVSWTFLAGALVTAPLSLLVLHLKEDWNVDPRTALQANLTLLLDKATIPRPVYSIAESLDLFSAWMLTLLCVGYGSATGRRPAQAAAGVLIPWVLYVLGKAALASVF
jgi:Yip1-like protein